MSEKSNGACGFIGPPSWGILPPMLVALENVPRMTAPICPTCGALPKSQIRVVYGMPSPEDFESERRGEIILGGCVLQTDSAGRPSNPQWRCRECGISHGRAQFGEADDTMLDPKTGKRAAKK